MSICSKTELDAKLRSYNQQQLITFFDELDENEQNHLAQQIKQLDIDRVTSAFAKYSQLEQNGGLGKVEPIPSAHCGSVTDVGHVQLDAYWQIG
jgi:hypothetical protein